MNQILSVETPKKNKNSKKASTHSVVVVFAIILLLLGIGITSTGAVLYYKNISNKNESEIPNVSTTKPKITIEVESASLINIVASHDKEISNITYKINDEDPVKVDGKGEKQLEKEVELPVGETVVEVTATDINGISSSYETHFDVAQKPTIKLEPAESKVKATIESTINIDYVEYYWDEDEENGEKFTINDVKNSTLIDILEGEHTLHVKAVDIEGNEAEISQKVMGVNESKPEIDITTDGEKFYIKATDEKQLTKIEIKLNSKEKVTKDISGSEYEEAIDLEDGANKLKVKVYNNSGLSETSKVKYTKE